MPVPSMDKVLPASALSSLSTASMGFANVKKLLPANSNPTGFPESGPFRTTIKEPESPGALNGPGSIMIWPTNRATPLP